MGLTMFRRFFASLVLVVSFSGSAQAFLATGQSRDRSDSDVMETDETTLAPLSFVRFCMMFAEECRQRGEADAVIDLTPRASALIARVNTAINQRIRPVSKISEGAIGTWLLNPARGDCNDYAVSKRHELIKLGFPASALLLATARIRTGEGHLVLIARTDQGDLVLDNLGNSIRSWSQTGYTWIKRQSSRNPRHWETVQVDAGRGWRVRVAQAKAANAARIAALKAGRAAALQAGALPHAIAAAPAIALPRIVALDVERSMILAPDQGGIGALHGGLAAAAGRTWSLAAVSLSFEATSSFSADWALRPLIT